MRNPLISTIRLADPEGDGLGPHLNEHGAFLGIGTPLLESETDGSGRRPWRPRSRAELERVMSVGYGLPMGLESRMGALRVVADALSKGDVPRAAIALLHARLPALPDRKAARRMAEADPLAKYSPLQPRVPKDQPGGGQWTREDGGAIGTSAPRSPVTPAQATIVEPFVEPFGAIRPIPFPGEINPPTEITTRRTYRIARSAVDHLSTRIRASASASRNGMRPIGSVMNC